MIILTSYTLILMAWLIPCISTGLLSCRRLRLNYCLKVLGIQATETIIPGYVDLTKFRGHPDKRLDLALFIFNGECWLLPESDQTQIVRMARVHALQWGNRKLFNHPTSMIMASR